MIVTMHVNTQIILKIDLLSEQCFMFQFPCSKIVCLYIFKKDQKRITKNEFGS